MTEGDALRWLRDRFGAIALARLERFAELVIAENQAQNLVSRASLSDIWVRHIVDSAQLLSLSNTSGHWVDIGTGAGFPGMVVAMLRDGGEPVTLIEPRRRRVEFLIRAASELGIDSVTVEMNTAEMFSTPPVAVISARAVGPMDYIFRSTSGFSDLSTTFLLPRGRSATTEVAEACRIWQGMFHVEPSLTSPEAGIVVASKVQHR